MDLTLTTKKCGTEDAPKEDKPGQNDDYVTLSIGAFGYWQLIFVAIASLTRIISSWNIMSIVFLTPETDFVCKTFIDNSTIESLNNTCYNNCKEYSFTSIFEETLISKFGLICEKQWLVSFTQSMMMFGILCGVSIFGWFSDRFGRSKGLIYAGVTNAIFMFVIPFCPNYWSMTSARFLSGLGTGGYLSLSIVYISELVGSQIIGSVLSLSTVPCDGIGLPIQAGFAYLTSDSKSFMIVYSSVTVVLLCITFFLPETPRWLIAKGKGDEAADLLTKTARFNKRDTSNINEKITTITNELNLKEDKDINLTYLDLFRTKKLTLLTMLSVSLWFVTGFSYFGLLQHVSQFGSNLYVVVTVLGLVQIIAAPLSLGVVRFFGRKTSSIGLYLTIGVLSLALIFVSKGSAIAVIIGSLGVIAATLSFTVVYVIVIEIYPTTIRNMGLSVSSVGSKVAAMVAPFVVNMRPQWIPSLIFAAAGFSAVLFCFLLPETKGKKLKDTIKEYD